MYYVKLFSLHEIPSVAHTMYIEVKYVREKIVVLKEIRARQIVVLIEIRAIQIVLYLSVQVKYFCASQINMDLFEKSC